MNFIGGLHIDILHVGQKIKAFEKDFSQAKEQIAKADEAGKFATQLTTFQHFYDVTAHRYMMEKIEK